MTGNKIVISLYDFTGEACKPWAAAGYTCHAFDIQHPEEGRRDGNIHYRHADLHKPETYHALIGEFGDHVVFGMGFPVCTDLSVSGAAWFKKKAAADPLFQTKAVTHAVWCADFFDELGVPYFVENPVSVLATKWRKPDYSFHPYEYGGYIPDSQAEHPRWPEYIAKRDAYKKKTCLWTGGGFVMPDKVAVDCESYHGNGYSTAMMKLGGKSQRTKDIRSATPRGFAAAVYHANKPRAPMTKVEELFKAWRTAIASKVVVETALNDGAALEVDWDAAAYKAAKAREAYLAELKKQNAHSVHRLGVFFP